MILHIYNPEHDIALGKNSEFFTPPKAARLTRAMYCHRPAMWAADGDWVLVDDISVAERNIFNDKGCYAKVRFVTMDDLAMLHKDDMPEKILPWGWDKFLVAQLLRCNPLFEKLLPSREQLDEIRRLSSRCFVAETLLPMVLDDGYIGEMLVCKSEEEVVAELQKRNHIVVKSPWSCSGRGVRFLHDNITHSELGWIRNILKEQGCVTIEPLYDKVVDFAMEFYAGKDATEYHGLNIFETRNGAYIGNIEGSQEEKLSMLAEHVPADMINMLKDKLLNVTTEIFRGRYTGPFGIDMMIVLTHEGSKKIHSCVEMNLRRTMGQ